MHMITRVLTLALMAGSLAACTHLSQEQTTLTLSNGRQFDYFSVHVQDPIGIDTATNIIATCEPGTTADKGKCDYHATDYGNPGIGKSLGPALVQGASFVGGLALQKVPQYNSTSLLSISNQGSQAQANGGDSTSAAGAGASSASNSGANVRTSQPGGCDHCSTADF